MIDDQIRPNFSSTTSKIWRHETALLPQSCVVCTLSDSIEKTVKMNALVSFHFIIQGEIVLLHNFKALQGFGFPARGECVRFHDNVSLQPLFLFLP